MKVNDECNWLDFYFRQMLSLWWSQGIIFRFGILRDHVSSLDGDISVLLHHHHVYHIWMAIGRISIWWFNTMADGNQDRTGLRIGKTWSDHHQVISNALVILLFAIQLVFQYLHQGWSRGLTGDGVDLPADRHLQVGQDCFFSAPFFLDFFLLKARLVCKSLLIAKKQEL